MKAAQITEYGEPSNITITEIEKPSISADQVLVKVAAASLNPFDLTVLSGGAQSMAPLTFPATLGLDFAGTIIEIGSDVTGFAIGDNIYGTANAMFGGSGAFAEYVATPANNVAHTASNISFAEASSLPTAAISALQALNTLDIQSGQKIFIDGGAGGVGTVAIQIAKARGAYVTTTASSANTDFVESLGADKVIDYRTDSFTDILSDYDAALALVRSGDINDVIRILKNGGKAVSLVGPFNDELAREKDIVASAQVTQVTTESLKELSKLIESKDVKPLIDKTFDLDHIQEAYESLKNDSIRGKIIISLGP